MTDYMGLRHSYQRRGHFLETRTQIHGPYHTAEELTAAYDRTPEDYGGMLDE